MKPKKKTARLNLFIFFVANFDGLLFDTNLFVLFMNDEGIGSFASVNIDFIVQTIARKLHNMRIVRLARPAMHLVAKYLIADSIFP